MQQYIQITRTASNAISICNEYRLISAGALIGTRRTRERTSYTPLRILVQDILDTRIRPTNQHDQPNTEHQRIHHRESDILPCGVPFAFLEDVEPEEGGEVEGEAAAEQARDDAQEVVEEGDRLGDHPGDEGEPGDQSQPDHPAFLGVDVADLRLGEDTAHDVFSDDRGVNAAGDEDDGERETESDTGDQGWSGEDGGAVDVRADEGVDDGAGESIDEYLHDAERPDRLDVVRRRVHFRHETILADGERVGEHDVRRGNKSL